MLPADDLDGFWRLFLKNHAANKLSHAQLLCSPNALKLEQISIKLSCLLLCQGESKPCQHCQSCHLVAMNAHPDLTCVQPDKEGGVIKIDQIRALQSTIYTSTQLGGQRVVIINPAEKMNHAGANALLKMLEEPPSGVFFLLLANHISTIPVTILSRCQQWRLSGHDTDAADYLTYGRNYAADSHMGKVFHDKSLFINDLNELINNRLSVCSVAAKWVAYDFHALLCFFYLLHAQLIQIKLLNRQDTGHQSPEFSLANQVTLPDLFLQLDKINGIIKKLNHTISVNQLLALENLLIGYTGVGYD